MCPFCSVWILWIVHPIVIELVLPCPRVMSEKPHPDRLRNPLQQSPHPQSTFYLRTPLAPSTSRSSSLASVSTSMLLDSRATGMFINQSFMQKHQLETTPLPQPILVCNIDGSSNENGSVTEEVHITLHFGHHSERAHLAVANLGQQMVIIGHSWLTLHNPEVDWATQ